MDNKNKINWLRGFLESIELADSVSKNHIKVLKEKLTELLNDLEDDENEIWDNIPRTDDTKDSPPVKEDVPF